jgi:branched-chain amino acid transport system substrate-binding protein
MKIRMILGVITLSSTLLLGSCSRAPYSVGFIGPMTGPSANIGVEGYRGFTMAMEGVNAGGGVKGRLIRVQMLDDQSEPAACLAAARDLVARGIQVLVLHTTSGAAAGALPWLLEQDVLVVTRTVSDPAWAGLDDNFLRFVGSTAMFGQPLGAFAATRGRSSLGLIVDTRNAAYADSMISSFISSAGPALVAGRKEIEAGWSHDVVADWTMAHGMDGVFAVLSGLDAAKLAQALERAGFAGDLYLSPWSQDHNLLNYAGRLADRIFLTSSFNPDDPAEAYASFKARHRDLFGDEPVMSGVFGYEMGGFLIEGLRMARRLGTPVLKEALLGIGYFDGLQYGFSLDAYGDGAMQASIIGIRDGLFVPVGL